jgi:hypothetical protein
MSKNVAKASDAEQDERPRDSVYDFLYCDTRRIGSFLAQFNDAGHLQQIIERESVTRSTKRGFKLNLGGGALLAGTGGSGNIGLERSPEDQGSDTSERVYDPLWTNARVLLDYLDERQMIERDITGGRLGQFVLASGRLAITDLAIFRALMELPSIRRILDHGSSSQPEGNRAERKRQEAMARKTSAPSGVPQMAIDMLSVLPHTIQARFYHDGVAQIWCSLETNSLVTSSGDILLKHGVVMSGEWFVLGILDAIPAQGDDDDGVGLIGEIGEEQTGELAAKVMVTLVPFTRQFLGRPKNAFGMTPLLIFRQVSG